MTMIKKEYIQPNTDVFNVELQPLMEPSITSNTDPPISGAQDPDEGDEDNRARRNYEIWDDEDEEDY